MTEYRGWVYVYAKGFSSCRSFDWRAWNKSHESPTILYAATESDIRKEIKQASKPQ